MKFYLLFILIFVLGCSSKDKDSPVLIGGQFLSCDHFTNSEGDKQVNLVTPTGFSVSPIEALNIVKNKTNFKCHHKFGAQVYADKSNYYFVRSIIGKFPSKPSEFTLIRVVINGKTGSYWYLKSGI